MMTHLERYKNSLDRKPFDRIPLGFEATPQMTGILKDYLKQDKETIIYKTFDIDRANNWPESEYIGPELKKYDDGTYDNMFGVRKKDVELGYSEAVGFPLANATSLEEIESYPWASPDWFDYKCVVEHLKKWPDYACTLGYLSLGWYSWEMRGMDRFLEDLVLEPEIAEAIIEKYYQYGYEYFKRIFKAAKDYIGKNFVSILLADDLATQEGLLISPQMYRKYFKGRYRNIVDMAHSAGVKVEFHICGSATGLIPELIETGIDVLDPIQTSARGMDPRILKEKYGKDLVFSGGVDVQTVLPFGTRQEVKDEVKFLLDVMGKDGGYVLEPSHAIQEGTPPENIVAMYEAAFDYYGIKNDYLKVKGK